MHTKRFGEVGSGGSVRFAGWQSSAVKRLLLAGGMVFSMLFSPGGASGDDITWTNTASGDFADADNWDGAVPGSADKAIIKLDSTLTVDFNADAETDMLQIGNLGVAPAARAKILFDLNDGGAGYTYNVVGNATPSTAIAIGGTKNVADPGDMATLTVTGGKLVTTNGTDREIRIAYNFANGTTGRLVVSGEHARVQSDILRTARNGETGHLVIEGGATVAVKTMTPGLSGGSTCDSRITVRDPGTTFELGQLYRHEHGRLVIIVENGAEIIGSTQWQVADKPLSDANVLVTGSGSRATTGNFYTTCWSASSNRNTTVIVADGGRIDSTAVLNQFTYGTAEYLVKDAGSQWNASSTFYLAGRNATTPQGDDVVLVVGEGGAVTAPTMYVHHRGRLYGEGSVTASSGVINRGGLVEPGLPDHTFDLADVLTNDLDQTIGTLTIDGNYTQEVYDDAGTDRIGTLRIKISGDSADKLSVDGNLSLVAHNGVKPRLEIVTVGPVAAFRDFNILDWTGSFSGEFEVILPESTAMQWNLDRLYSDGVIRSHRVEGSTFLISRAD